MHACDVIFLHLAPHHGAMLWYLTFNADGVTGAGSVATDLKGGGGLRVIIKAHPQGHRALGVGACGSVGNRTISSM